MEKSLLKLLAADIYQFFHRQDDPPAHEIYVPIDIIRQDTQADNCYQATIRYIVDCCGRKVHSVRIRFNIDDKGRFINNSWNYV